VGARDQIVAMRAAEDSGQAYMFALEKRGDSFAIVKRASLDTAEFKSADWKALQLDLDGDGYDEVIYREKRERIAPRRANGIYDVRRREAYALRAQVDSGSGATHFTESQN